MTDHIHVERQHVYAYHGVYDAEKEKGQDFYVSLDLYLDLHAAGRTDDLTKGVSYAEVMALVNTEMLAKKYNLIEAVADRLCFCILKQFPMIQRAVVTVSKPNAPVDLDFADVSVTVERKRTRFCLSYGSNMGDKEEYIEDALIGIAKCEYIEDMQCSHNYVTEPYGMTEQDMFVNGALIATTIYTPEELLDFLHEVEASAGRVRLVHWGPRTLDLDIIFFGDLVMNTEKLTIPHADMVNRKFVLEPLSEIAGWYRHPINGKTVNEMYADLLLKEEAEQQ